MLKSLWRPVRNLEEADRRQTEIMKIIQSFLAVIAISLIDGTALGQSSDVSALLRKADELDAQEQTDAAIETLIQAEKISPNNPSVLIKLSQDYSDKIDAEKNPTHKLNFPNLSLYNAKQTVRKPPTNPDPL